VPGCVVRAARSKAGTVAHGRDGALGDQTVLTRAGRGGRSLLAHAWSLIWGDAARVVLGGDGVGWPRAESLNWVRSHILNFLLQVQIYVCPIGRCILASQITCRVDALLMLLLI